MKMLPTILSVLSILLTVQTYAHPLNSDTYDKIPVGTTLTALKDINIAPNKAVKILVGFEAATNKEIAEIQRRQAVPNFCYLKVNLDSQNDRIIPAGTQFKVTSVSVGEFNDLDPEELQLTTARVKFEVASKTVQYIGCSLRNSSDARIGKIIDSLTGRYYQHRPLSDIDYGMSMMFPPPLIVK